MNQAFEPTLAVQAAVLAAIQARLTFLNQAEADRGRPSEEWKSLDNAAARLARRLAVRVLQ